ncbi:MAG: hypothetical protein J2P58_12845 [Acidimicrobiaceae bacterium]|nr:hypothetical protein [Acidimicrobiaceae bacterium]
MEDVAMGRWRRHQGRQASQILKAAAAFFARELEPATADVVRFIDTHQEPAEPHAGPQPELRA